MKDILSEAESEVKEFLLLLWDVEKERISEHGMLRKNKSLNKRSTAMTSLITFSEIAAMFLRTHHD